MEIWASTLTVTFGTRTQSCQFYVPTAPHSQGNSSLLFSVRDWVDPRTTECGQKESATWKLNPEPPVLWRSSSTNWGTCGFTFNLVLNNFTVCRPLDKPVLKVIRNLNLEIQRNNETLTQHITTVCVCNFINNLHVAIIRRSLSDISYISYVN